MRDRPSTRTRLRDALRSAAPWPVRRFLRSLAADVSSLPDRLRDPLARQDPWHMVHNVGGGGFAARATTNLTVIEQVGGRVEPNARVLDMGCGHGALALALLDRLSAEGGYVGFDVALAGIRYAQRRFAAVRPDFRFEHARVRNLEYGAAYGAGAHEYRFPVADGAMTHAVALSLFTHLSAADAAAYLQEASRALACEGLLIATFYLLDEGSRAAIANGQARRRFVHAALGGFTNNPERPEAGMAHEWGAVLGWLDAAGFGPVHMTAGEWRAPAAGGLGGQDVIVARRRARAPSSAATPTAPATPPV